MPSFAVSQPQARMRFLPFRHRLRAALAATVTAALAVSGVAYALARTVQPLGLAAADASAAVAGLDRVAALLSRAESAQRSYLLVGDGASLLSYRSALRQLAPAFDSLTRVGSRLPTLGAALPTLRDVASRRVAALDHGLGLRQRGDTAGARRFTATGHGRLLMDSLLHITDATIRTLNSEAQQHAAHAAARAGRLSLAILGLALTGCLAVLLILAWLGQGYRRMRDAGEQALTAERDRVAAILQEIPDPLFVKDVEGRYLLINEAARAVWDKPAEAILGTDDTAHFPAEVASRLMAVDQSVIHGGETRIVEEDVPGPAGPRIYLSTKAPLRSRDGVVQGLIGVARDITARVVADREREQLLARERAALLEARAARDTLEGVLDRISEGFVALDLSWRYTYVNPRAGAMFGRQPVDLLGKHIWTEFPTGIGQPFHLAYERALATQEPQHFEAYYAPWQQWYVNRVYPSPDGLSIFFEDVTERKRQEAESQARTERLRAVLAATPLAVVTLDLDGRVTGWHGGAERIFGWTAEEVEGRRPGYLPPEDTRRPAGLPERAGQATSWLAQEGVRLRKDGVRLPVSISTAGIFGPDGAQTGVVVTYEDISRRRSAEREREQLLQDLRGLAAHLESVREEERLRISREIHDQLGQALTGLRLGLDWLARHAARRPPAEREQLRRLEGISATMLESTRRLAHELRPPPLEDLGLAEALGDSVEEFRHRTGIAARFEHPPDFPVPDHPIASALYRVAQEALANVVRHAAATQVTVRLARTADCYRLEVVDDGRGFQPSVPGARRSLGLIGMRERVATLGGSFQVLSAPGEGTRVIADVPVHGSAP